MSKGKKKTEEQTHEFADLSNKTIDELISYNKALAIILGHYDNLANASTGRYADKEFYEEQYVEARKKIEYYTEFKNYVFSELEKKVEKELLNNAQILA